MSYFNIYISYLEIFNLFSPLCHIFTAKRFNNEYGYQSSITLPLNFSLYIIWNDIYRGCKAISVRSHIIIIPVWHKTILQYIFKYWFWLIAYKCVGILLSDIRVSNNIYMHVHIQYISKFMRKIALRQFELKIHHLECVFLGFIFCSYYLHVMCKVKMELECVFEMLVSVIIVWSILYFEYHLYYIFVLITFLITSICWSGSTSFVSYCANVYVTSKILH